MRSVTMVRPEARRVVWMASFTVCLVPGLRRGAETWGEDVGLRRGGLRPLGETERVLNMGVASGSQPHDADFWSIRAFANAEAAARNSPGMISAVVLVCSAPTSEIVRRRLCPEPTSEIVRARRISRPAGWAPMIFAASAGLFDGRRAPAASSCGCTRHRRADARGIVVRMHAASSCGCTRRRRADARGIVVRMHAASSCGCTRRRRADARGVVVRNFGGTTDGGTSYAGNRAGLGVSFIQTGPISKAAATSGIVGISSGVNMLQSWGGSSLTGAGAAGYATAVNPYLVMGGTFTNGGVGSGEEIDISGRAGATFLEKYGLL